VISIIEWVIKIGGSLFPKHAINLAKKLKGSNSLIIMGGGNFANLIRQYDQKYKFSSKTTHELAIDSMDILSKLLDDKLECTKLVYSIQDAIKISNDGFIPILVVSKILKEKNPFEYSWDISSDSIAAYFSNILKAKLLIATNVEGIYTREPSEEGSKFISKIDAKKLLTFEESSVDLKLPSLLIEFGTDCYVVNGKFPERVLSLIRSDADNYNFKYTKIISD
jgi:aspartokinase-like uncharacterized kinase